MYRWLFENLFYRRQKSIIDEKFFEIKEKVQPALNMLVDSAEKYPLLEENEVIEFKNEHGEIINDKGDLVISPAALEAGVDAIITGDKHFDNTEVKELQK